MKSNGDQNDPNGRETPCNAWQTTAMKNQIKHLTEHLDSISPKHQDPVVDTAQARELTDTAQTRELAEKFFPDIKITGVGLRIEKKRSWGGLYYRVLKKRKKTTEESAEENACIQWLYVWTKQKFFFSFGETLIPSFILFVFGFIFFNNFYGEQELLTGKIGMILVSGFCIFLGSKRLYDILMQMIKRKEKQFYLHNSMLLLPMGLCFLYYVIYNPSIWRRWTSGFLYGIMKRIVIWRLADTETKELLIPHVSVIFFVLGLGLLLFWLVQPKTHEMDWAPLFIYIKKKEDSDKRDWELDKVIFDSYHYYTSGFICKKYLKKNSYLKGKTEACITFEISNFWHSFDLFSERRRTQYNKIARFISYLAGGFTFVFYLISYFNDVNISVRLAVLLLWLLAGGFTFAFYHITYFIGDNISVRLTMLLLWLLASGFTFVFYFIGDNISVRLAVLLLWLFGGFRIYSKTTRNLIDTKPKETTGDEEKVYVLVEGVDDPVSLDKCIFHLTEDRIKTFWTLKGNATLLIKSKLQNPFISDFDTFRDKKEEDSFMKRFLRFLGLLFRRGEKVV